VKKSKYVCVYVNKVQILCSIKRVLELLTLQHPGKVNTANMQHAGTEGRTQCSVFS